MKINFFYKDVRVFASTLFIVGSVFVNPIDTSAAIVRTLSLGSTGIDVVELQQKLNADIATRIALTGPGSPGQETNYFGILTHQAVIRYQEKYRTEILTPIGLVYGTGIVGPQTIQHLNKTAITPPLQVTTSVIPPTMQSTLARITGISQTSGTNGDEITLYGEGFSKKNKVLIDLDRRDKYTNIASSDNGTRITFTLDTEAGNVINEKKKDLNQEQIDIWKEQFPVFIMPMRVETEYGMSNPINFTYLID